MKKITYPLLLFFFTSISFSQYFFIGELESENQSDTMECLIYGCLQQKEVVGKDLNMVSFQKEFLTLIFL